MLTAVKPHRDEYVVELFHDLDIVRRLAKSHTITSYLIDMAKDIGPEGTALVIHQNGWVLHMNAKAADLFEMPASKQGGWNIWDAECFTPQTRDYLARRIHRSRDTDQSVIQIVKKNGVQSISISHKTMIVGDQKLQFTMLTVLTPVLPSASVM
jgi:hypothetical protein